MLNAYELWERDTNFNIHKKVIVTNVDLYTNTEIEKQLFREHFFCYDELNHSFHRMRNVRIVPIMKINPIEDLDMYNWDVGFEIHTMEEDYDHPWYFAYECGNDAVLTIAVNQARESFERLIEWSNSNG